MAATDVPGTQLSPLSKTRDRSRSTRLLTSWKVWLPLLLVGLGTIATVLGIPLYRRIEAIRYLQGHRCPVDFTDDSEWMTERFGEVGTALRPIERVSCRIDFSDEVLCRLALLGDVPRLDCAGYNSEMPTQTGLDALRSLSHLEGLSMEGFREPDAILLAFLESPSPLRSVFISNGAISADAFAALSRKETITFLMLSAKPFSAEDFREFRPMPQLLELEFSSRGRIDMDWLRHSTQLRELGLWCPLSNDDLEEISRLDQLTSLMLVHLRNDHPLTVAGVEHLTRLPNLRTIGLPENLLTMDCIEILRRMPNLKYVISSDYISDKGVREVVDREWELSEWGL